MYVPATDKVGVVFHEEGADQHTDVHTVVICVCGQNNLVKTQSVQTFAYAQRTNQVS